MREWSPLLEIQTTPNGRTQIKILNATTIHAKILSGDKFRPNPKLETSKSTLAATLILPATQEYHKLPKHTTLQSQIIHATWHEYIALDFLPTTKTTNFETITTHPSLKRVKATHKEDTFMIPSETISTTYDVLEVQGHIHLNIQTTYLVTE